MALRKELKNDKGIIGNYHRIGSVSKNHDKLVVIVVSYADESYREKEKELIEGVEKKDELIKELSILTAKPEENAVRIAEIEGELEKYNYLAGVRGFNVFSTEIVIPYTSENEISFSEIYKYLSEEDTVFNGGEIAE